MSEDNVKIYSFITTPIGKYKLSQARSGGIPIDLTHIAVGDGGGAEYDPIKEQSDLKNETWRGEIDRKTIHPKDPNIVIVIGIVPDDVGGFFIRELSIIDADGDPIYISAYPTSYKPAPGSNISKDMILEQWLVLEDADLLTLTADLNVCRATLGDINDIRDVILPTEKIATIHHDLGRYPKNCEAYYSQYALGAAGLDEGPLGGDTSVKIPASFELIEHHALSVIVPKMYACAEEIEVCKISDYEYGLAYPSTPDSLHITFN